MDASHPEVSRCQGQMYETEPLVQIHPIKPLMVQNEQGETSTAIMNIEHEQQQSVSGNVAKNSFQQLGLSSEYVNKTIQSQETSRLQQTLLAQTQEFGSANVYAKPSELEHRSPEQPQGFGTGNVSTVSSEQHQLGSDYVQNEPVQTSIAIWSYSPSNLEYVPGKVTSMDGEMYSNHQASRQHIHESDARNLCPEGLEQNHHHCSNEKPDETHDALYTSVFNKEVELVPVNVNLTSSGQLGVQVNSEEVSKNCLTENSTCPDQSTSVQNIDLCSRSVNTDLSEQNNQPDSVMLQDVPTESSIAESQCVVTEHVRPSLEVTVETSPTGQLESPCGDINKIIDDKQPEQPSTGVTEYHCLEQTPTQSIQKNKNSTCLGHKTKRGNKSVRKKYMLRSLVGSDRALRSRIQEKPNAPELSNNLGSVSNGREHKRKMRKNKGESRIIADEFSQIRKHLRYLLNRISYEQNLIDAYSSEGWKGYSLEKLKPEKELQRATTEILRRKLKIRDLFQRLESLCAEGMFPESLFDSEGQIDSEDIYCAKCGSKEVSAGNDIILCDGACDRGFHQLCLTPPLLSEDIPPDDEGWLCPGCDCKVDCIDLLNESQGTDLSVTDSWEKVYPEAARAAEGKNQVPNLGLPSDESDDDDYDPDVGEADEKIPKHESSSDESEYASASEGPEAQPNDDPYVGLPSDDSEDNDYDPYAPKIEEDVTKESSSSDFTSDSEDLAALVGNVSSENDEAPMSLLQDSRRPHRKGNGQSTKRGGKKPSLKGELLSLLKSGSGEDGSPHVLERRQVERLDYKRLHDEAYGNDSSDSSDEDWSGTAAASRKKKIDGQVASVSANGSASVVTNGAVTEAIDHAQKDKKCIPNRRARLKSKVENSNKSPSKPHEGLSRSASTGGQSKSSSHRRLGEAITQRLYKSFKENQYPDRATKESLAQELGIKLQQVSKWFENVRWSTRHSSVTQPGINKSTTEADTLISQKNTTPIKNSTSTGSQDKESLRTGNTAPESGSVNEGGTKAVIAENSGQKSTKSNSRKRKGRADDQTSDPNSNIKAQKSPAVPETSEPAYGTRSRRKSVGSKL